MIGADGSQLGIMSSEKALALAESANLDLVKIAPNAQPPVCRIMDYGKYRFEQRKKEKENRKNQKVVETKGMKQVSNEDEILKIVTEVLDENPQSIIDFKNGKDRALGFMVGQVMKKSKGQANPKMASDLLTKELEKR